VEPRVPHGVLMLRRFPAVGCGSGALPNRPMNLDSARLITQAFAALVGLRRALEMSLAYTCDAYGPATRRLGRCAVPYAQPVLGIVASFFITRPISR
jgi:hypothetical protein